MLAAKRREVILDLVRKSRAVKVRELTAELGVSDMTIRRDLRILARDGLLEKVHGGATATSATDEPGFEAKSILQQQEKLSIARLAATLVEPGSAIGLSAGTTTWALAHQLKQVPELTVVTNSMEVALVFHNAPTVDQTVVVTGGVRTRSGALVGPVANASLRDFNLDAVFMGAHGMAPSAGFSTPNLMEAATNRALAGAGRRLIVTADSTKWGVMGVATFARLSEADVLVTDAHLGRDAVATLTDRVGEILLATPPAEESSPEP